MGRPHVTGVSVLATLKRDFYLNRKFLGAAVLIYSCAALVGWVLVRLHPPSSSAVYQLPMMGPRLILTNLATILLLGLGFFSGGILTAALLVLNGLFEGAFWASAALAGMLGPVVAVTLPHGILEFPAMWIAGAVGLSGGWSILKLLKDRQNGGYPIPWSLLGLAVGLILMAGVIEVYLSIPLAYHWGEGIGK